MFQGEGVVLKRGMQIGLGQMTRVIRFCNDTEICQSEVLHHFILFLKKYPIRLYPVRGMGRHEGQEKNLDSQTD